MANKLYHSSRDRAARQPAKPTPARRQAPARPVRATDPAADRANARQIRLAAGVLAAAMVAWMGLQWLGARWGWQARYAFLIDFAAIGAIVWSLLVTWRIWRRRRRTA